MYDRIKHFLHLGMNTFENWINQINAHNYFHSSHDNFKVSTDTTKAILSPDGRYACAGSHDGSLVVWNTETRHCENVLKQKHAYDCKDIPIILDEYSFF